MYKIEVTNRFKQSVKKAKKRRRRHGCIKKSN